MSNGLGNHAWPNLRYRKQLIPVPVSALILKKVYRWHYNCHFSKLCERILIINTWFTYETEQDLIMPYLNLVIRRQASGRVHTPTSIQKLVTINLWIKKLLVQVRFSSTLRPWRKIEGYSNAGTRSWYILSCRQYVVNRHHENDRESTRPAR